MAGPCPEPNSPRRGESRDDFGLELRTGLRLFWLGLGIDVVDPCLDNPLTCPGFRPMAELARVDGVELPESEFRLGRRELTGMRDCESRLYVRIDAGDEESSGGGGERWESSLAEGLGDDSRGGSPVKSLLVRRCIDGGRLGTVFSVLISSNVGVTPRYQADGDDGEILRGIRSTGNIGFGLCMLPSEPRLRRGPGIP